MQFIGGQTAGVSNILGNSYIFCRLFSIAGNDLKPIQICKLSLCFGLDFSLYFYIQKTLSILFMLFLVGVSKINKLII
jgi:hypothetical protein